MLQIAIIEERKQKRLSIQKHGWKGSACEIQILLVFSWLQKCLKPVNVKSGFKTVSPWRHLLIYKILVSCRVNIWYPSPPKCLYRFNFFFKFINIFSHMYKNPDQCTCWFIISTCIHCWPAYSAWVQTQPGLVEKLHLFHTYIKIYYYVIYLWPHLLIKTLHLCASILFTLSFIFSFSATSSSAILAIESTLMVEPNTLILSVSIGVLAMRIFAFSNLLGWCTPTLKRKYKIS